MPVQLTEMAVRWNPGVPIARREAALRGLIMPAVSLSLTLVLLVVIAAWMSESADAGGLPIFMPLFFGLSVLIGTAVLGWSVLRVLRAQQERTLVGDGLALLIDHRGIGTARGLIPWPRVASVTTIKGEALQGPQLVITDPEFGRQCFVIEALDVLPAGLESAVRIFSRGQHGVDLSAIED